MQRLIGFLKNVVTWLNNNKLASAYILSSPYLIIKAFSRGEFNTYIGAAEQLRLGNSCYHVWLHYQGIGNSQYGYSPLFATLLIPFSYSPVWVPALLFLLADVWMLFHIFKLLLNWLDIYDDSVQKKVVLLTIVFSLRMILHNFEMVQMNILLLWVTLQGLQYLFFENKISRGAFLLALGINFKILPLVFIPYLIFRKQLTAVLITLIFTGITFLLPAFVWGYSFNFQLHQEWLSVINPFLDKYNTGQNVESYRIHGLAALFSAYFSKAESGSFQLLLYPLNSEMLSLLTNAVRLLLIVLTLFFLRQRPFNPQNSSKHFFIEVSYLLLITPLIFPQQNKWAFVYSIPAYLVIFYAFLSKSWKEYPVIMLSLIIVFALTTLTTDGIIGKRLNYYTESLKLVTIGTILIIPILMYSKFRLFDND
ncbi:MAG: DUF2029 domain-containing protein [Bacteroidetes bacterium]|nr:DUF2029 domain-containing protein [Bacteroidota bacterium]